MKYLWDRRTKVPFFVALILLYSTIGGIYLVLPVSGNYGGILLGSVLLPGDAWLTSSILEWGFQTLFTAGRSFFDWNAGFPIRNTLASTENLVGWQVFYSPLRMTGMSVAAAYNTLMLGSLIVSGLGAALLARRLGTGRWGAAAAGVIFAYGPFHLNNMMHIQTMAVCWTPFAILYLDRYLETPRVSDGIGLGAAFLMTALSSVYFGAFLAVILPLYSVLSWSFGRHRFDAGVVGRLSLIAILSTALVSPLALPYVRFASEHGRITESGRDIASLSLEWSGVIRTPSFQMIWAQSPLRWPTLWDGQAAFFGVVALVLMVAGVLELKRSDVSGKAVVRILLAVSLICYALALGPYFKTGGDGPARVIEWIPMPGRIFLFLPGIRWPTRIFFFGWLGGSILVGLGLTSLRNKIPPRGRNVFAACAILLIVAEYWPSQWLVRDSVKVSSPLSMSDAYPFLARESDRGGVIEFPISHSPGLRAELKGRYIYGATGHLRGTTALLGARIPPLVGSLERAGESLPAESGRRFLLEHGVTRIVVHRFLADASANTKLISSLRANGFPTLFDGRESVVFGLSRDN